MVTATTPGTKTKDDVGSTAVGRELTKLDRCDICSAEAYVLAIKSCGELLFCAHHYNYGRSSTSGLLHQDALLMNEWTVFNYCDRLNEKPSVSANAD